MNDDHIQQLFDNIDKLKNKACKPNKKKQYKIVSNQQRRLFIDLVQNKNMLIREAAEICDIGYENAKVINRVSKRHNKQIVSVDKQTPANSKISKSKSTK